MNIVSRFLQRALIPCLALALALPGLAAEEPADSVVRTAPVEVDGRVLFSVRGVSAFPAAERAAGIADRIRALARDPTFATDALRVEPSPLGSAILGRDVRVLLVTDADASLEEMPREPLAEAYRLRMARAIEAHRAERGRAHLTDAARGAGVATVLLALAITVALIVLRRLGALLDRRYRERVGAVSIQSFEFVRAERLWSVVRAVVGASEVLAVLALAFVYLRYVFDLFPWTRGVSLRLDDWVLGPLAQMGRSLLAQTPNLIFLTLLFFIVRAVLRAVRLFFDAVGRGVVQLARFDADWAEPTYKLVRVAIVAFAIIVAYPYIPGSESAAFKGVSLFLGIVFSLGSSSAIANIVAGYTMTYRRAFREGDRVKVGDVFGDVTDVRLQVTHFRTPKNEEVVVPNSTILNSEVVNYSTLAKTAGLILHTTVGIGYETPWRQVEAMLILAAERTPGLLREPKPFVLQKALGDFAVTYEINVYCDDPQAMPRLYTELHRRILDVFNEYGIQIMTPAYEGDPERPKIVPRQEWFTAPATQAGPDGA